MNPYQSPESDQKPILTKVNKGLLLVLSAAAVLGILMGVFDPAPKIMEVLVTSFLVTAFLFLTLLVGLALYVRLRRN